MKLRRTRFYHDSGHRKRYLVREAKSKPCVDCLAEGRRADWPLAAMTLDHLGKKTMDFTVIGSARRGIPYNYPSYIDFTPTEIIKELSTSEAVCASHHNVRTRARLLAACPDEDEDEDDEIALF